jgi:hypothetical protein
MTCAATRSLTVFSVSYADTVRFISRSSVESL